MSSDNSPRGSSIGGDAGLLLTRRREPDRFAVARGFWRRRAAGFRFGLGHVGSPNRVSSLAEAARDFTPSRSCSHHA
jgi:hypothetical protein